MKRLLAVLSTLVYAGSMTLPAFAVHTPETTQGSSTSTRRRCSNIWSGLWAGANFDVNSRNTCPTSSRNSISSRRFSNQSRFSSRQTQSQSQSQSQSHSFRGRSGAQSQRQFQSQSQSQSFQFRDGREQTDQENVRTSELYIALGDSVAAGAGLAGSSKPMNNDSVCDVSPEAYPTKVATELSRSYINAACSGATAGDMVTEQNLRGTSRDIRPQLDTAFAHGTPRLITITAGANDVRWVEFVLKCYQSQCGTNFDETAVRSLLTALELKLEFVISEIERQSGGSPPAVVFTGYYNPLSRACVNQVSGITADEISWFNRQVSALNNTIRRAAGGHDFVRFASVSFRGHELCTADPWIQSPNDPAPIHPTERGQEAIARAVVSRLR